MNDILKAVILGVVEGATEFLPVSSTGHLILVGHWLGFVGERANLFEIVIQLGAILAVIWQYRAMLIRLAGDLARRQPTRGSTSGARRLFVALAIAFMPAAIVGFLTHKWITARLFNPEVVAWALVGGGILMWAIETWPRTARVLEAESIRPRTAFGIGLAQVASLVPGMSRSASTIMGALWLGVARPAAAEFSFLLAIPVMFAATGLGLFSEGTLLQAGDIPVFVVGFLTAFASALIAIRLFLRFVARHDFRGFAIYRIVFGLFLLAAVHRGWMG